MNPCGPCRLAFAQMEYGRLAGADENRDAAAIVLVAMTVGVVGLFIAGLRDTGPNMRTKAKRRSRARA